MQPTLAIIVPCYNEQEVLPETIKRLGEALQHMHENGQISPQSYLLFVDDGSKDNTWPIISAACDQQPFVSGLKLAGNVGHQNALMAGLMTAKQDSDCLVTIDADLQDDIEAIAKMVEKYQQGCDIVYGVRNDRKNDSFFKKHSAQTFYKLMSALGAKSVYNHADFRLMSRRAVEGLAEYGERNLFLRGVVPLLGFQTDCVYYERAKRFAGESKYPLKKMLSFAFDGITSFSIKPITLITWLGGIIILLSIAAFCYTLISYFTGHSVEGWSSLILSIWFLGGVQLLSVGIVGQYVGKIYIETKHRPRYHIEMLKHHKLPDQSDSVK